MSKFQLFEFQMFEFQADELTIRNAVQSLTLTATPNAKHLGNQFQGTFISNFEYKCTYMY
jgi:hypothetical protein